jgi:hypothetical protein
MAPEIESLVSESVTMPVTVIDFVVCARGIKNMPKTKMHASVRERILFILCSFE